MSEYSRLRETVCAANLDLVANGLVICTWGNVSGIDRDAGVVAIKPSGVSYESLGPQDIVLVTLDGQPLSENGLKPSSDLPTHLELYRAFPNIGGVAHTHSPKATAFAQACRPIPCFGTTHADHFFGTVPVTRALIPGEIAADYERQTGLVIVESFVDKRLDPDSIPAVLVAHHGPFTWGGDPAAAVMNSVVLEAVADMARDMLTLAPEQTAIPEALLQRHFLRKHGPGAYYGQG